MPDERTPSQRAALIAYWFGQGEGLTRKQIHKIGGSKLSATRLVAELRSTIDIRQDENGVWSCHYGTPSHPQTPRQRAILIAYELATKGEVRTGNIAKRLGVDRRVIYRTLCSLSIVLPIYYDEHTRTWKVLDMRELD